MLKVGKKAPQFKAIIQTGAEVNLSDYKGKKLVLYFYPKDNTPGCTAQACDLRDNYNTFKKAGYQILGVSTDGIKSHNKFITKFELPFDLITDEDHKICELYGVWGEKIMFGRKYMGVIRTTFVINEVGVIEQVISAVDTKAHAKQLLI